MSVVELQAPTVGASHRPDVPCRRLECDHSAPLPDRDSPRGAHPNTVPKRPFHHPLPQFSSHRPQTWHVVCILQDSVVCQVSRLLDKRQRRTFEITFGHPNTGVRIVRRHSRTWAFGLAVNRDQISLKLSARQTPELQSLF